MKAWIGAVAVAGALASWQAMAQGGDGNELIQRCTEVVRTLDGTKTRDLYSAGHCLGLVSGVMDTLTIVNSSLPRHEQVCYPPQGIQYGQAVRIVVKYLNDHPTELHRDAASLTVAALRVAYPCEA